MRREPDPSENNSTGSAQAIGLVFATTMQQTTVPLVLVLVLVLETTFRVAAIVAQQPACRCVATRTFPLELLRNSIRLRVHPPFSRNPTACDTLGCQSEATWRNEFNDRKTLRGNGYAERRIRRRPPITPQTAAKANAVDGSGTAAGGVL
jgi:hypothetical protein